jgi:hypothetical protein
LIFLKENSYLQERYEALQKLRENYPKTDEVLEELNIVKKDLEGENEIKYQLSKSNLGLYVLRDINIEFEDLKAQIDCVVITKRYCYFIECKNLVGNITINEKGDFIRKYTINNRKIKKSNVFSIKTSRSSKRKIWRKRLKRKKETKFIY